jgi:hypothetical protein
VSLEHRIDQVIPVFDFSFLSAAFGFLRRLSRKVVSLLAFDQSLLHLFLKAFLKIGLIRKALQVLNVPLVSICRRASERLRKPRNSGNYGLLTWGPWICPATTALSNNNVQALPNPLTRSRISFPSPSRPILIEPPSEGLCHVFKYAFSCVGKRINELASVITGFNIF